MACPVDYDKMPMGHSFRQVGTDVEDLIGDDGNIAGSVSGSFRTLRPVGEVTGYVDLLDRMWNDDYVAAYQAMNGWSTDHIPLPGATARQMFHMPGTTMP